MPLTVFPLWDQQFTDDDGVPLALGKVYSYITGTDTPSSLFTDGDGDVAWDNPIVLGADGRFSGMVYQDVTPALKILITDAAENPMMHSPFDPIIANAAAEPAPDPSVGPTITTQPQDATISAGDNLVVSVIATGTAPLSYQWYLGSSGDTSTPIDGATAATYTAISVGAGVYTGWTRVSNAVGTADSLTATITVT